MLKPVIIVSYLKKSTGWYQYTVPAIVQAVRDGESYYKIAKRYAVSATTVRKYARLEGVLSQHKKCIGGMPKEKL